MTDQTEQDQTPEAVAEYRVALAESAIREYQYQRRIAQLELALEARARAGGPPMIDIDPDRLRRMVPELEHWPTFDISSEEEYERCLAEMDAILARHGGLEPAPDSRDWRRLEVLDYLQSTYAERVLAEDADDEAAAEADGVEP